MKAGNDDRPLPWQNAMVVSLYWLLDYHYKKMNPDEKNIFGDDSKNMFGQVSNKEHRNTVVAGIAYTLPMLFTADARVDGDGKFRFQLSREDVPVTKRLRFSMMVNTDKEYMAGFRYIATKYISCLRITIVIWGLVQVLL